jgi:hypothetical protein
MQKRYLILGLILFGVVGCVVAPVKANDNNKSIDNNHTIVDINSSKKVLHVDLDREIKQDYSKGGLKEDKDKIIPIFISKDKGANDEVAFKGEVLKRAKKIKVGDNDEVAFSGEEYTIKTSELKDGEFIFLIDKNEKIFITMKIREY